LATVLGVSRQSVNKELQYFEERGWIELRRGSVTMKNPRALRAFWSPSE